MGRIKNSEIKKTATKVYEKYREKFKCDFEHNKKALDEVGLRETKSIRNKIAGYITKKVKIETR